MASHHARPFAPTRPGLPSPPVRRRSRQRWHRPSPDASATPSATPTGADEGGHLTEAHLVHSMGNEAEEGYEGWAVATATPTTESEKEKEKEATATAAKTTRAAEAAKASGPTSIIQLRSQWELSQSLRHLDPSRPVFDAEARVESWQRRRQHPETVTDEREREGPQRERRLGPPNSNHSLPPLSPVKFLLGNSPEVRERPTSAVIGLRTPSPQVKSVLRRDCVFEHSMVPQHGDLLATTYFLSDNLKTCFI